jgi:hypothetical protein
MKLDEYLAILRKWDWNIAELETVESVPGALVGWESPGFDDRWEVGHDVVGWCRSVVSGWFI